MAFVRKDQELPLCQAQLIWQQTHCRIAESVSEAGTASENILGRAEAVRIEGRNGKA